MARSVLGPASILSGLAAWVCACTGGPLPSTTDAADDAETGDPDSESSTSGETTAVDTGTDDSGTDDSGTDDSGSDDSGTDDSTTDDSGTDESTTDDSTTDESTTDDSTTDDSTTDDACDGLPTAYSNLTIDADTPTENLACVASVSNRLTIEEVDWTDLSALPALATVGQLRIRDCLELTNLSGTSLVELEQLTLTGLPSLTSTTGLEQLVALEQLYVSGLPSLAAVDLPVGLPTVRINAYLSDLDMLAGLQPQPSGSTFEVHTSSTTVDIAGLMGCCAIPELDLYTYSHVLTDFTDLQGITTMAGLHVHNAGQLTGFAGLEQLESIGTLEVIGGKCDNQDGWRDQAIHIPSLAGLDSLAAIDTLRLRYLFDLESLAGLAPDATITTLELRNLVALTYAEAEAFADAAQALDPLICGLAGDPFCYLNPREGAPCPQ